MNNEKESINQALVTIVIEKALTEKGEEVYDKTVQILKNEYQCELSDCYTHPEYLRQVLEKHFGGIRKDIVDSINKDLKNYNKSPEMDRFLSIINQ